MNYSKNLKSYFEFDNNFEHHHQSGWAQYCELWHNPNKEEDWRRQGSLNLLMHLYYVFEKWKLKVKVEVKSESKKRKWKVKISKRKWQRRLDPWWSNFVWWSYEWNGESWSNFELWMRIFIVKRLDMTSENGSLNGRIRNDNNCATRTHLNEFCNEWTWTILKINSFVEKP